MKKYRCICCGESVELSENDLKKLNGSNAVCPICGYMMYELPNERAAVLKAELAGFVNKIIDPDIGVSKADFKGLAEDLERFPNAEAIKKYVSGAGKTEDFYKRLKQSAEQMHSYFHEPFSKNYKADAAQFIKISENTAELLQRVLPEFGISAEFEAADIPDVALSYSETPNAELIESADELIGLIEKLADKIYKFIRMNNIYGRAYDIGCTPRKKKAEPKPDDQRGLIEKKIADCEKVLSKKYVADIFSDGSEELGEMLKALWSAVYLLMAAPIKARSFVYNAYGMAGEMNAESCSAVLNSAYMKRFRAVSDIVNADDFLSGKSEYALFELYDKMLEPDIGRFMKGSKGMFVIGKSERKLEELVGLEGVKNSVRKIKAYALANKGSAEINLNMCFLGNPGTGKTEVARIIAGILHENGLLPTDKVVETDRSGLVAGYLGQTALKTSEKIAEAMGGVLFIDEAYSLAQGDGGDDYGLEAISTLLKAMEDMRGKFCVILAGYKNQMAEMLASNPGFQSRIQFTLDFPNYSRGELAQIVRIMLSGRGYSISDAAAERVLDITDRRRKEPNFANAREVRNIIEQVIMCQNVRCVGTENKVIEPADVNVYIKDSGVNISASGAGAAKRALTAEEELEALVGLRSVKRMVKKIKAYAKRNKGDPDLNLHMCFCGSPGTGKTEVARILSSILYEAGVLPEAKLTETDAHGLISKYVGETASKTLEKINEAMGGVIFIDEAYSLAQSSYGDEAAAVLLKQMEDKRGSFCVIMAGYKQEMADFLAMNTGLASRIQFTLDFPDYTREELGEIAVNFLHKKRYEIEPRALDLLLDIADYYRTQPNFANARAVRNIAEQVIMDQNLRTESDEEPDNTIIISDVEDYIADENLDLGSSSKPRKIGF